MKQVQICNPQSTHYGELVTLTDMVQKTMFGEDEVRVLFSRRKLGTDGGIFVRRDEITECINDAIIPKRKKDVTV